MNPVNPAYSKEPQGVLGAEPKIFDAAEAAEIWRRRRGDELLPAAHFDFGVALKHLRNGSKVARSSWNGRGQYLALQLPDEKSQMTLPYIYIHTVRGQLVPWLASQTDLLEQDWCVVRERSALEYLDRPGVVVDGQQHIPEQHLPLRP